MTDMRPTAPQDAEARRAVAPVICYPNDSLAPAPLALYTAALAGAEVTDTVIVPPRDGAAFDVPAGHFFRITCHEGPQVGDLNLWNAHDLSERFYSGKTRAIHGSHVTVGDRLWSSFPTLRPMATLVSDSLAWYGIDPWGGAVHDVIGTRCDPYTGVLLKGETYHNCCHSNLTRALSNARGLPVLEAEPHVHDVLNVFMCTGFTRDTGQYFMKQTPARAGDQLTAFAEIDLLGALSACPGGDCGTTHSSDAATCFPLKVEILAPPPGALADWSSPPVNAYDRSHGLPPQI